MAYSLLGKYPGVRRHADGALIPEDPRNLDWQAYQAWVAEGNETAPAKPPVAELVAHAEAVWAAHLAAGETFDLATDGAAPVPVLCDGTPETRADLALLALFGQVSPDDCKTWLDNHGTATVLTGAQLVMLAVHAGDWISNTYPALAALLGEIGAGRITTAAEIDAFAWPTS